MCEGCNSSRAKAKKRNTHLLEIRCQPSAAVKRDRRQFLPLAFRCETIWSKIPSFWFQYFLFASSHLYNTTIGFSVSSFIFCTMCCFSKKEQPPPQTGMPPSVCRVWTEFLSDSETWIEFRRNYSLRLKPELPPSMCNPARNRFKYGAEELFGRYWQQWILQISGVAY